MNKDILELLLYSHILESFNKLALEDNDLISTSIRVTSPPKSSRILYNYAIKFEDIPFDEDTPITTTDSVFISYDKEHFIQVLNELLEKDQKDILENYFFINEIYKMGATLKYIIFYKNKFIKDFSDSLKSPSELLKIVNSCQDKEEKLRVSLYKMSLEETLEAKNSNKIIKI